MALVALVFVAMCYWSWGKWADPLVDFGRELYTPWRLSEGDLMGQDVAPLFGPLSSAIHANLFLVFGVDHWTIFAANLAFLACFTLGIFWLIRELTNAWTAAAACIFQLCVFSFSQYFLTSGYNFIAPYSHEMTHGLGLTVLLLIATFQFLRHNQVRWLVLAGLAMGLTVLTKLEPALAALSVGLVFFVQRFRYLGISGKLVRQLAIFLGAGLSPVLICLWLLWGNRTGHQAWQLTSNAFAAFQHPEVSSLIFYQRIGGWDAPLLHLKQIGGASLFTGVAGASLYLADRHIARIPETPQRWTIAVIGLLLVIVGWPLWQNINGALLLPTFSLLATLYWSYRLIKSSAITTADSARIYALTAWSVASLVLLLKILLAPSWVFYGFALSLLATLQMVVFFCDSLPRFAAQRHQGGRLLRNVALLSFGLLAITMLRQSQLVYTMKSTTWNTPAGDLLILDPSVDSRSEHLQAVTDQLLHSLPEDATMAVIPEGVTLNFLLRRRNPTPYINLMPPELLIHGEDRILESWRDAPPDWVLWWPKDTREYGRGDFGLTGGYAARLGEWIENRYELVRRWDAPQGPIRLLKRRNLAEPQPSPATSIFPAGAGRSARLP